MIRRSSGGSAIDSATRVWAVGWASVILGALLCAFTQGVAQRVGLAVWATSVSWQIGSFVLGRARGEPAREIRVALAERYADAMARLSDAVAAEGYRVVGQASIGTEMLELVRRTNPDMVFLELPVADLESLQTAVRILHDHPTTRLVMRTPHGDHQLVIEADRGGVASVYDLADPDPSDLFQVMAHRNRVWNLHPALISVGDLSDERFHFLEEIELKGTSEPLTPRESQVLRLLALGSTMRDVADQLSLDPASLGESVHAILRRLRLRDWAVLVTDMIQTRD